MKEREAFLFFYLFLFFGGCCSEIRSGCRERKRGGERVVSSPEQAWGVVEATGVLRPFPRLESLFKEAAGD